MAAKHRSVRDRWFVAVLWPVVGVLLIVCFILYRNEQADKAHRYREYSNRESHNKAHILGKCAEYVCDSSPSIPESVGILRTMMIENEYCRTQGVSDSFVDGYGTPFELRVDKDNVGHTSLFVKSAGFNKSMNDRDDRIWTFVLKF